MMIDLSSYLTQHSTIGLVRLSLSFQQGEFRPSQGLQLTADGQYLQSDHQVTQYWPDGSIKIALVSYYSGSPLNTLQAQLVERTPAHQPELNNNGLNWPLCAGETSIIASSDQTTLTIRYRQQDIFQVHCLPDIQVNAQDCALSAPNFALSQISPYESLLTIHNQIHSTEGKLLNFTSQLQISHLAPLIKLSTTVHNPTRAMHPGATWDLGDANAFLLDRLSLKITYCGSGHAQLQVSDTVPACTLAEPANLQQWASGGENWQSPVHVDCHNQLPLTQNGFTLTGEQLSPSHGLRATPLLSYSNGAQIYPVNFWQNFPNGLVVDDKQVQLEIFPLREGHPHEIQGGERKTHDTWLALDKLSAPITQLVEKPPICCHSIQTSGSSLYDVIEQGLSGEANFFAKRERIDEYGWRNFGDLYADHETDGYTGDGLFVSHYNNQYDPIYGFLKQYGRTADERWFTLANDLAKHVIDIDIYHTSEDKAEYNGGLFWHTDHYLQAYTSTHRCYSTRQQANAYQDHSGGGGPGGQHCYTTGLAQHYLLTGEQCSKQAVVQLADWISRVYEGTDTFLELLLAIKNRQVAGYKNHLSGQYPLDRGTANYLIAQLDAWQLTQDAIYIQRIECIIFNTAHPNEDITARQLEDVENTWFYTVYLQALCRYLDAKHQIQQYDDSFYYARDTLLQYADWMLENEYPYLEKPEILEYPNHTWTAQDIRKAFVFHAAYFYSPQHNAAYLEKGRFFANYVQQTLENEPTRQYTRILAILMQNDDYPRYSQLPDKPFAERKQWPTATYQQQSLLAGLAKQCWYRLTRFSPAKEYRWLSLRLK